MSLSISLNLDEASLIYNQIKSQRVVEGQVLSEDQCSGLLDSIKIRLYKNKSRVSLHAEIYAGANKDGYYDLNIPLLELQSKFEVTSEDEDDDEPQMYYIASKNLLSSYFLEEFEGDLFLETDFLLHDVEDFKVYLCEFDYMLSAVNAAVFKAHGFNDVGTTTVNKEESNISGLHFDRN